MTSIRIIAAMAAVASMVFSGFAYGVKFRHVPGTSRWLTAVSGLTGSYQDHVATSTRGIFKIGVGENSDDPIWLQLHDNDLDSSSGRFENAETLNTRSSWSIFIPLFKYADIGEDRYVTAVQVCVNNEKIKGVKLWGARITSSGQLQASQSDSFARPNCNGQWKTKVSCASKKIATGVRAYYKSSRKGFSGLTLRCTKIEPR